MAEPNLTIEQSPPPPRPKKNKLGMILGIFIFLLLAAAFGYVYFQLAKVNRSLVKNVHELQDQTQASRTDITTLQSSLQQISTDTQKSQDLAAQQAQMIADWKSVQQGDLEKWYIAEAQYLVKLANDYLQFMHDANMAFALLQRAEQVLNSVNNTDTTDLRKSIADAVAALQINPQTDLTQVYMRINALNLQLDNLPFPALPLPEKEQARASTSTENMPWWKAGLHRTWESLKQVVVVKNTANTLPLVIPEEKLFLNQNLHAQLESAMWAVLHRNSDVYNASLDRAIAWVKTYYAQDAAQTQSMLQALADLRKLDLSAPKVDLSAIIKAFDDYNAKAKGAIH